MLLVGTSVVLNSTFFSTSRYFLRIEADAEEPKLRMNSMGNCSGSLSSTLCLGGDCLCLRDYRLCCISTGDIDLLG